MALSMNQAMVLDGMGALGYIDAIAASVGPLAGAGADIYKTSADSKQNRKELKQREREFKAMLPLRRQQQKQAALETVATFRQQQVVSGYGAAQAPYMLGIATVLALAVAAIGVAKYGRRS